MKKVISVLLILSLLISLVAIGYADEDSSNNRRISDKELQEDLKTALYEEIVTQLDNDELYISNVQSIYLSQEYIDELGFNSKKNVYFGYTLDELNAQYQGTRYVFTLGDDGQTTTKPLEVITDDTYEQIIRNVAIGSGVIVFCITASVVTGAFAGTQAISMMFIFGASKAIDYSVTGAAIGGISKGIITGFQTGELDEALKAAALGASEGFKWGAIVGSVTGAGSEALGLYKATLNGLTMNEAAFIQRTTAAPLEFISNMHSMAEFEIYQKANLETTYMENQWCYYREIDLSSVVDNAGRNNIQRIADGLSPRDPSGIAYELHHVGQTPDAPLAILTKAEHIQGGNYNILHFREESAVEHGAEWSEQVAEFWKAYLNYRGVTLK